MESDKGLSWINRRRCEAKNQIHVDCEWAAFCCRALDNKFHLVRCLLFPATLSSAPSFPVKGRRSVGLGIKASPSKGKYFRQSSIKHSPERSDLPRAPGEEVGPRREHAPISVPGPRRASWACYKAPWSLYRCRINWAAVPRQSVGGAAADWRLRSPFHLWPDGRPEQRAKRVPKKWEEKFLEARDRLRT